MTYLSATQKLNMSLDEIDDFENIQNVNVEDGLPTLCELSDTTYFNMEISKLEEENDKLKKTISNVLEKNDNLDFENTVLQKKTDSMKQTFKSLIKEKQNTSTDLWKLQKEYTQLSHKFNENVEITTLYNWIIHKDSNSLEYASGYGYHSESLWDTSFIKEKIAMSTYLLLITENETMYCLPYYESAK